MREIRFSLLFSAILTSIIMWSYYMHAVLGWFDVRNLALVPKDWSRIYGIFTIVLVHGSLKHFVFNIIPLFVLISFVLHFYLKASLQVILFVILVGGLGVFLIGEESSHHIGASGLVFGLITFLIASGFIRQNRELIVVSFIVVMFYGGTLWGVFPMSPDVSWEGHLFGAIAGVFAAIIWRKTGPGKNLHLYHSKQKSQEDEYIKFSS